LAAKASYVEKVGSVYYVRKRIPRAWSQTFGDGVLRMSLRTSDRPTALRLGVGALSVFEELLSKETADGLIHLMEHIIQELDLNPDDMTRDDIIRRRALQVIGAKLIRRVGDVKVVDQISGPLREEFVHFNYATERGAARLELIERRAAGETVVVPPRQPMPDLSDLRQALRAFSTDDAPDAAHAVQYDTPSPAAPATAAGAQPQHTEAETDATETVWTMRALLDHYMARDGKETGADNKANVERAVTLFEAVLPRARTVPVMELGLKEWNEVYDFFVKIPAARGQQIDDLAAYTRKMIASGESYQTLSPTTLNSNYLGVLTRLINFGKNQRQFLMTTPNLTVRKAKRATSSTDRVPFTPPEITAMTSCPVYLGSRSVHHRYSPGDVRKFDDHIYWAPLISAHTGMRVSEIGMIGLDQFQYWYGKPTLVLEIDDEDRKNGVGYKTQNALRRVPFHQQLVNIGLVDFIEYQRRLGHSKLFPNWVQHVKGAKNGTPEVHYEASFFNENRARWGLAPERRRKLSFHSFRYFFIQACLNAKISPYTALKMVGHDADLDSRINDVHAGYHDRDLTEEEVCEIDRVKVPLGPIVPFRELLARYGNGA
jgi:integrase